MSQFHKTSLLTGFTFIAALAGAAPVAAQAVEEAAEAPAAAGQTEGLQDIVVTAERRQSTVQRTPISITAVTGEELMRQGVRDASDLASKIPNVSIANNVGSMTVNIRGIGTNYDNQSAEPAVNVNVDGVYLARAVSAIGAFYDIERIEALRGPQGTLYGRNSTGGSVNIITKKPVMDEFQGQAEVEVGNYDLLRTFGMLNVPVVEGKLAVRAAFQTESRAGYTDNAPARDYNDAENVSARLHVLFTPNDTMSLLLSGDYGHFGGVGPTHLTTPAAAEGFKVPLDTEGYRDVPLYGASAQFNWDLGPAALTYIGAYRYFHRNQLYDNDFTITPATTRDYYAIYDWKNSNWSHELRLASTSSDPFKWVVGGFYYTEDNDYTFRAVNPSPTTESTCFCNPVATVKSWAVFGQGTYKLTDTLSVTGGLRYTKDRKTERGQTIITPVVGAPRIVDNIADLGWENVSGKFGLEWQVSPRSLVYGSVSNGYKGGGYYDGENNTYKPEKLYAYEIGTKNRFFDSRLQVNASAFYYDYKDFQAVYVVTLPGGARVAATGNADKSRSYGAELETEFLLTPDDRFDFSATYLNAKFIDFVLNSTPPQDYSGFRMPRSPKFSLRAGYGHTWNFNSGATLTAHVQTYFQTKSWLMFQHFPGSQQDSYTRTDFDLTFEAPEKRWYVSAYVRNAENSVVAGNAVAGIGNVPALDLMPPRTYGVRLGARF
jgi:iron complex outermembrane receptor protein